jgi:hypothetical protein
MNRIKYIPFRSYCKNYDKSSGITVMSGRDTIDWHVIKPLYDMRHIFKEDTEVKALCFCTNFAFEVLLWNAESHLQRERLMERLTDILKERGFYTYLKKNGIEEQNLITKMLEGFFKAVVITWNHRGTIGGKFGV